MARRLKIITGLILFTFVTVHLVNLAIGFFSMPVADDIRPVLLYPFTTTIGGYFLIASALLHMVLGVQALYQRNTLRMTGQDTVQLVTALLIPVLLIPHAWVIVANNKLLGIAVSYFDMFQYYWVIEPLSGLRQVLLVLVIWIHGCIGLFTWIRLKPWWPKVAAYVYPLAVAIPVLALMAFVDGGKRALGASGLDPSGNYRESFDSGRSGKPQSGTGNSANEADTSPASRYGTQTPSAESYGVQSYGADSPDYGKAGASDNRSAYSTADSQGYSTGGYGSAYSDSTPAGDSYGTAPKANGYSQGYGVSDYSSASNAGQADGSGNGTLQVSDPQEIQATHEFIELVKWRFIIGYIVLLLVVLAARAIRLRSNGQTVEVHYANGEVLSRPVGLNLLELSTINDIPHASLCRGRGRCGTCRVRIYSSESELDPPNDIERETLARTGSGEDVRLACQLKPGPGVIAIERLLTPEVQFYPYSDVDGLPVDESTETVTEQT